VPERKVFKDYQEADVREVFERGTPSSWQDLVNFLEKKGMATWHVTPGEDAHMIADGKQAMKDNVPFTHNSEQAYRILKSHRNPELVRQEEQRSIAPTEPSAKQKGAGKQQTA
jgi:hypothetical protein